MSPKEPTPRPAPEYVGPADERGVREDVSTWELRPLVVRTLDEVLQMQCELGRIMGELGKLARKVISDPPPFRDPEASWHEWDPAVRSLRQTLKRREKDGTPFTGRDGTAIVEEFDKALAARRELAVWRAIKSGARALTWETLKYFLPSAIVGAGWALWQWLKAHG